MEGPTLFDRLRSGPLPVPRAVELAIQIAEAMEYAHERGVIHRDLKPANVKIAPDGRVKVLDFGLAKAMADPATEASSGDRLTGADSPTVSPTLSSPITGALTGENVILGTAAYMSPEQARGKPVDRRSDVWSFGVVLWEMLTGERLFAGETISDTVASILKVEPDPSRLPDDTPPRLRELLERCLAKDPRRRLRDLGDIRLELEWIRDGRDAPAGVAEGAADGDAAASRARRGRGVFAGILAAFVGAVAAFLLGDVIRGPVSGGSGPPERVNVLFPEEIEVGDYGLSPDGRWIIIWGSARDSQGESGLYLRSLDDYEVRPVPNSWSAVTAVFSPDSRWLAFAAAKGTGSSARILWKIPLDGSAPPLQLRDWDPTWSGLHWLPDGDLVTAVAGAGILRLPADGGPPSAPVPLVAEDLVIEDTVSPRPFSSSILPGGTRLLSTIEAWGENGYQVNIVCVDVETGSVKLLLEDGGAPSWSPTGHLLFSRGASLLAVPLDPERLEVTGGPVALLDDLRIVASWNYGRFSPSAEGSLLYDAGGFVGGDRRLIWVDGNLRELEPWSDEPLSIESWFYTSPDGQRVATVQAGPDGVYDVYVSEPGRPVLRKWVEEPGRDCASYGWSPDGESLLYLSRTASESIFYIRPLDGGPSVKVLEDRDVSKDYRSPEFVDGGTALLLAAREGGTYRVEMRRLTGGEGDLPEPEVILENAAQLQMSPDGRWLGYVSDSSGRREVYVRRWLGGGRLGPERRVSTDGVQSLQLWYRPPDGGHLELWFLQHRQMYAVSMTSDGELSRPRLVGDWPREYLYLQPSPDGRLLLLVRGPDEAPPQGLNLVRGWTREAERRLSGRGS